MKNKAKEIVEQYIDRIYAYVKKRVTKEADRNCRDIGYSPWNSKMAFEYCQSGNEERNGKDEE